MQPKRPNLLILTSSFPRNLGDETCGYVRDFARSLADRFNVHVLAPPDSSASDWPEDAFTLSRSRSLFGGREPLQGSRDLNDLLDARLLFSPSLILSLLSFFAKAFILALRSDVICSHWMIPSGLTGAAIARVLRKPHVVVEHSGALHFLEKMRGGSLLARFIAHSSERIVAVSADLQRKLIALCPDARLKVEVLSMGIGSSSHISSLTLRERLGPACADETRASVPRTILFIGRLTEIKGLRVLLKAAEGVEGWRLVIAGEGRQQAEFERQAEAYGIAVRFAGRVNGSERAGLFAESDVVVIPSVVLPGGRTEGMPLVCLEALAAGCPVIASRVGGLPEIISDGENGLLFDPGDHRMLREKLLLVLSDAALRQKMVANGRLTAALYDWSLVGTRFAEIIRGSLNKDDQNTDARRLEATNADG